MTCGTSAGPGDGRAAWLQPGRPVLAGAGWLPGPRQAAAAGIADAGHPPRAREPRCGASVARRPVGARPRDRSARSRRSRETFTNRRRCCPRLCRPGAQQRRQVALPGPTVVEARLTRRGDCASHGRRLCSTRGREGPWRRGARALTWLRLEPALASSGIFERFPPARALSRRSRRRSSRSRGRVSHLAAGICAASASPPLGGAARCAGWVAAIAVPEAIAFPAPATPSRPARPRAPPRRLPEAL